jgi:ribonuclease HI
MDAAMTMHIALCDGFCKNNGSPMASTGGSYIIYEIPDEEALEFDINKPETLLNILNKDTHLIKDSNLLFTFLPSKAVTNNEAEAWSLFMLLTAIRKLIETGEIKLNQVNQVDTKDTDRIVILMDSLLIVNQVKHLYKVNNQRLKEAHRDIEKLLKQIGRLVHPKKINEVLGLMHIPGDIMKKTAINH